jgi:hypothetical protein
MSLSFKEIERIVDANKGKIINNYLEGKCNWCFGHYKNLIIFLDKKTYFAWVRCNDCVGRSYILLAHPEFNELMKLELSEKDIFTIKCLI